MLDKNRNWFDIIDWNTWCTWLFESEIREFYGRLISNIRFETFWLLFFFFHFLFSQHTHTQSYTHTHSKKNLQQVNAFFIWGDVIKNKLQSGGKLWRKWILLNLNPDIFRIFLHAVILKKQAKCLYSKPLKCFVHQTYPMTF